MEKEERCEGTGTGTGMGTGTGTGEGGRGKGEGGRGKGEGGRGKGEGGKGKGEGEGEGEGEAEDPPPHPFEMPQKRQPTRMPPPDTSSPVWRPRMASLTPDQTDVPSTHIRVSLAVLSRGNSGFRATHYLLLLCGTRRIFFASRFRMRPSLQVTFQPFFVDVH